MFIAIEKSLAECAMATVCKSLRNFMSQLAEPGLATWPIGIHSRVQHKIVGHHNLSGTSELEDQT